MFASGLNKGVMEIKNGSQGPVEFREIVLWRVIDRSSHFILQLSDGEFEREV